ncbi:hypothetical protein OGATHE_000051 [Ogataea polymorpha]|uniref:Uncharacterized protein n=1 Tax=Ogataea polymorpha TaxID=460523 RepID=A0A9P8PUR9_9ASCO|nr:hypothetical protein OGATHE_000051 [Ogataea polymorpha]
MTPNEAHLAACSRSASSNTTSGDLPPHSSDTFLRFAAALCITLAPVAVDPVNATLSRSGCSASLWPATEPSPETTLNTPAGNPASLTYCANSSSDSGVSSLDLITNGHPHANAGQNFHPDIESG